MHRLKLVVALVAAAAAQPCLAAGSVQQAAVFTGSPGKTPVPAKMDDRVIAYVSGVTTLGDFAAASHASKQTKQRPSHDGSAEGALLSGAGLLSAAVHLTPIPLCADQRAEPSVDCQVIAKLHSRR